MPGPKGKLVTPVGFTATDKIKALLCDADGKLIVSFDHTFKRSLWVPALTYQINDGAPSQGIIGHGYCQVPYWALDDSANESVCTSILLPSSITANLNAYVYFCMDTATAGVVNLTIYRTPVADGVSLETTRSATGLLVTVPDTAKVMKITAPFSIPLTGRAGVFQRHTVIRWGGHVDDTATGDMFFLGTLFTWDEDILADH